MLIVEIKRMRRRTIGERGADGICLAATEEQRRQPICLPGFKRCD